MFRLFIKDNYDFMKRWDYTKNITLNAKLDTLTSGSSRKAWFVCGNGHEYERQIGSEFSKSSCKYCKSLAFVVPEVVDIFTENNNGTAWDFGSKGDEVVELRCQKHGVFKRTAKYIVKTKINGGLPCLECNAESARKGIENGDRAKPTENNLVEKCPQLIPLWSDKNNASMDTFSYGSDEKVWWKCLDKSYHPDYKQSIYQKARMGTGCPCCSGRNLVKEDSFASVYPDYVKLWSDKNLKTPYEYTTHSNAKVWFKCENGLHSDYQQTVNNKSHGKMCMKCGVERSRASSLKPKGKNNTIGSKRPSLIPYWSDNNEKTIYEYNYGTDQFVWWKCENGIHEDYKQKSSNKVFKGYRCPKCKYSRGEKLVSDTLDTMDIEYITEYIFLDLHSVNSGTLRFDFYIPSLKTCIEYDGIQHFEPVGFFGGKTTYELQVKNDELKDDYCMNNDIKLIRIPYFLSDEDVYIEIANQIKKMDVLI